MWIKRGSELMECFLSFEEFEASSLPAKGWVATTVETVGGIVYESASAALTAAKVAANASTQSGYERTRSAQAEEAIAQAMATATGEPLGTDETTHLMIAQKAMGILAGIFPASPEEQAWAADRLTVYGGLEATIQTLRSARDADIAAWSSFPYPEAL